MTVYFDNPNMDTQAEYENRAAEARRLVTELALPVPVVVADWDAPAWREAVAGTEDAPEGGARCARCSSAIGRLSAASSLTSWMPLLIRKMYCVFIVWLTLSAGQSATPSGP
ncbi:MAG: epoxyqueuosine reductase QueH [Clostridiales bacterium]|nr:epoxyqueuosine reductase QueH [Clostridiales bacterium]